MTRPAAIMASLVVVGFAANALAKSMPRYRGDEGDAIEDSVSLKSERKRYEKAFDDYRQAARAYQDQVRGIVEGAIRSRQKKAGSVFQREIDKLDDQEFALRQEAIERLEGFISRHRSHDKYTPDAMFRLAELYYEDSVARYNRGQDSFDSVMRQWERGKILDMPVEPEREFSRSIALYKYLHWMPRGTGRNPLTSGKLKGVRMPKRWPDFRYADAALYLQGFCEAEMGEFDKAIATLSSLEKHYPKSDYVAEAWLRVGEMYFDNNEFEQAADAYKRAAAANNPKWYGLALYKLGWAYFQMYEYPTAVRYFQKLIEYYDDPANSKERQSADLRKESIEYLAKSMAEPSWDGDENNCADFGFQDLKGDCTQFDPRVRARLYTSAVLEPTFEDLPEWKAVYQGEVLATIEKNLARRKEVRDLLTGGETEKPYLREVLIVYAQTLFDQAEDEYYRQAVRVMEYVVDKWPLERDAQAMQAKVMRATDILASAADAIQATAGDGGLKAEDQISLLMALQAKEEQIVQRRKYLTMFGKESAWYQKWQADKDLIRQVDATLSRVRINFAKLIHAAGQELRELGKEKEALAKYKEAAVEYQRIFDENPEADGAYDLAYTIAEVLYFAGKDCDALRDDKGDLVTLSTGDLVPYPEDRVPFLKESCATLEQSIAFYNKVRDWDGKRPAGDDGKPVDHTEDASFTSLSAAQRVLNAKAALPVDDPEKISVLMIPEIRPDTERDEKDAEKVKNATDPIRVERGPLAPIVVEWLKQVDSYVAKGFLDPDDPDKAVKLMLVEAELLYKNRNLDPWPEGPKAFDGTTPEFFSARDRFWNIIKTHPTSPQATESIKNLLLSYEIEADFAKLSKVADYMEKHPEVGDPKTVKDIRQQVKIFSLGVLGRNAKAVFEQAEAHERDALAKPTDRDRGIALGKAREIYAKAGSKFRELRSKAIKTETKLGALMNAQLAYYRAEKWDTCIDILNEAERMLRDTQATLRGDLRKLRGSKKRDAQKEIEKNNERMRTVISTRAELHYKFFRIPDAVAEYIKLYEIDPDSKKGAEALRTAADLAYANGNWSRSIELYEKIIEHFENDKRSADVVRKAANRITAAWEKQGNVDKQIESLERFIKRYEDDLETAPKVFEALETIMHIYQSRGDKRRTEQMYKRIMKDFDDYLVRYRKEQKNPELGKGDVPLPIRTVAAEVEFRLMEPDFDRWMATKFVFNQRLRNDEAKAKDLQKQVLKAIDLINGKLTKVKDPETGEMKETRVGGMYNDYKDRVAAYNSQWSYAAYLYRAKALIHFARNMYDAPRPDDLDDDAMEAYEEFLEKFGGQFENKAIKSLEIAMAGAEMQGAVNEWVDQLRAAINKYKPAEYPLLKEAQRRTADPVGVVTAPEKELR
jgi:tetratricopeptide (TPR) repeat protein